MTAQRRGSDIALGMLDPTQKPSQEKLLAGSASVRCRTGFLSRLGAPMNLSTLFPDGEWTDPKHTRQEHPCPFCQRTIPWAQFPSGIKVAGHGCGHTSKEIVQR